MEYIDRGSGSEFLNKNDNFRESQSSNGGLPEKLVAIICREMLKGLDYVHKKNKIHRDIKAGNVLFNSKGEVKLADFGVSAQLDQSTKAKMTIIGTPYWMAPEVILATGTTTKADIWSLGITAIEFATGIPPLANLSPMRALMKIPNLPPPKPEGNFSKNFKSFVADCLIKNPEKRPTAEQLLTHPFIKSAGDISLLSRKINQIFSNQSVRLKPARSNSRSLRFDTNNEVILDNSNNTVIQNSGLRLDIGSDPDVQTMIYKGDQMTSTTLDTKGSDEAYITMSDHPNHAKNAFLQAVEDRIKQTENKTDKKHLDKFKTALANVNPGVIGAILDATLDNFEELI